MFLILQILLSLWVYNGLGTLSYPTFFARGTSSGSGHYWVYTSDTGERDIYWEFGNGTTFAGVAWSDVLGNNKWQYLVFTYNQNNHTVELFVDGVSKTKMTTTNSVQTTSGDFYIGNYNHTYANGGFKGRIDHVVFFKEEMPASQIQLRYFSELNNLLVNSEITFNEFNHRVSELRSSLVEE